MCTLIVKVRSNTAAVQLSQLQGTVRSWFGVEDIHWQGFDLQGHFQYRVTFSDSPHTVDRMNALRKALRSREYVFRVYITIPQPVGVTP